jgi:hypothetical protein
MMPSTPDWKKEAEEKYNRERADIRHESKVGFALQFLMLFVVAIVLVLAHLAEWIFSGGNLIPSGRDAAWAAGSIAFVLAGIYLSERFEEAKSIREQRLIRLEMKIDALLDKHERIDSNFSDLKDEVREAYRNG